MWNDMWSTCRSLSVCTFRRMICGLHAAACQYVHSDEWSQCLQIYGLWRCINIWVVENVWAHWLCAWEQCRYRLFARWADHQHGVCLLTRGRPEGFLKLQALLLKHTLLLRHLQREFLCVCMSKEVQIHASIYVCICSKQNIFLCTPWVEG